jgi:hypothetical protein
MLSSIVPSLNLACNWHIDHKILHYDNNQSNPCYPPISNNTLDLLNLSKTIVEHYQKHNFNTTKKSCNCKTKLTYLFSPSC